MRDPRFFSHPEKFAPERWIENSAKGEKEKGEDKPAVLEKGAFIPFSAGPHMCVGRQLALIELRMLIARLVWEFEMGFGVGWDEKKFMDGWRDCFTAVPGEVQVEFTPRKVKRELGRRRVD